MFGWLSEEAARAGGVGGERRRQQLERHVAVEARVAREVDLAHPAPADLALDPVLAQHAPRERLGSVGTQKPLGDLPVRVPVEVFGLGPHVEGEERFGLTPQLLVARAALRQ